MPRSARIRVSTDIAAPQSAVWARVCEHEDTPSWVAAVKAVTLSREGTPRNGLGAIRVVRFKPLLWTDIHEEITAWNPPHGFEYVLFKGMPGLLSHLGRVSVEAVTPEQSRLHWDVDFVFRTWHPFRPVVPSFLRDFEAVLRAAGLNLKSQLEAR